MDENLLEQAILLFTVQIKIKKPTAGGVLKEILNTIPDINTARAACDTAIVPGLSSRERSFAYILIAKRLNEADLSDSALLFCQKAVLADPESPAAWMSLGELYSGQKQYITALACFLKISTLPSKVHTAKILYTLGWHDQALKYLDSLSPTIDEQEIVSQAKAECFAAKGDYQNAVIEFEKNLTADTTRDIWHRYAQFSIKTGNDGGVIRALPHILTIWNYDYVNKAVIHHYFKKGEDQEWLKNTLSKDGLYHLTKAEANRFLLASLISHQQKPKRITARIDAFLSREAATSETLWQVIAGTSPETWQHYPPEQRLHTITGRHEMVHRMARFLEQYDGDARGLWAGVTRGEVLRRLEDIGFRDTINDFIIRSLAESRPVTAKEDNKWNNDRHLNRITARLILGEDALPDHPDIVYTIREHFRNVDDILHRIGVKYCLVREYLCKYCDLRDECTKCMNEGIVEKDLWWRWETPEEDEPGTYSFTEGEEVHLSGTSVHGPVTEKMQASQEDFINLEIIEGCFAESGLFYTLIKDHPLARDKNR